MRQYEMLGEGYQAVKSLVVIDDNEQPVATIGSENRPLTIDFLGVRKLAFIQDRNHSVRWARQRKNYFFSLKSNCR